MLSMVKQGTTRIVLLIGNYAIKFPKFWNYKLFLKGLLANIDENFWWKYSDKEKLCDVYFCSPFGLFIIMKRGVELSELEYNKERFEQDFKHLPLDNKIENFGIIKRECTRRVVLIDYANSEYMCDECEEIFKLNKK